MNNSIYQRISFSGHESFQCRQLWLKKGYDFVSSGRGFNDVDAVVELGVGKNMVSSIRFWMKAFNLTTQTEDLTDFAHALLGDDGFDPFLEDEASLWLLHYHLVKSSYATIYTIVFNELRKEKIEFTRNNFLSFIKRKAETEKSFQIKEKTLLEDFSVLTKMYMRSLAQSQDKEDSFSGLLVELDMVKSYNKNKEDVFFIENNERQEIPDEVILYSILDDDTFDSSIGIASIEQSYNSTGSIFGINRAGLLLKIENITTKYPDIIFNDQAGIKELQFKSKPSKMSILEDYYAE